MSEDQPGWDGVERRRAFEDKVREAAVWAAAQEEVERQRKRDVKTAASKAGWRSFFICLAIVIPTAAVVGHVVTSNAKDNSVANCETQKVGRPIGNLRAFDQKIVLGLADAAFSQYGPKASAQAIESINRRIDEDRKNFTGALGYQANGEPVPIPHIKHFADLGGFLDYLPLIDCSEQIK